MRADDRFNQAEVLGRLMRLYVLLVTALLIGLAVIARAAVGGSAQADVPGQTPANFKVAFIGDQGIGSNAEAVLNLIANEGADMVLHQGDFGYGNESDPQIAVNWDAQITSILGADFPYFASVGNHDVGSWPTYQQLLLDRLALVSGASCSGDYGVAAACTYQGLFFILSGAGTLGSDHTAYIEDQLAQDDSVWRICTWHKNQTAMQVGSKPNDVGWGPYEACREGGAIIATGHEHSYSRTKTLSSTQFQTVDPFWPDPALLRVGKGSTFAFVNGLAGLSIRDQDRCLPTTPPYGCNGEWASLYTSDQGANYGALFIEFHVDGDPRKASGYFKNIDGETIDSFTITTPPPKQPDPGDTDGDGCPDADENGPDERDGGRRDWLNEWDYFNPTDDGENRIDDVIAVINHYRVDEGDDGYDTKYDRTYVGPDPWNLGPPNGRVRIDDALNIIAQYRHDCA